VTPPVYNPQDAKQGLFDALLDARNRYGGKKLIIEDLDRTTGISDIMRGTSDARETMGGQRLKSNNSSTRIRERQDDMARFARDVICNEVPLILHREIYALAALAGAGLFILLRLNGVWREPAFISGMALAFGIRALLHHRSTKLGCCKRLTLSFSTLSHIHTPHFLRSWHFLGDAASGILLHLTAFFHGFSIITFSTLNVIALGATFADCIAFFLHCAEQQAILLVARFGEFLGTFVCGHFNYLSSANPVRCPSRIYGFPSK
jgi:hypothetical protein